MNELMPLAKRLSSIAIENVVEIAEIQFDGLKFTQITKTDLNEFKFRTYWFTTHKWSPFEELTFEKLFLCLDCPSILIDSTQYSADSNPFPGWIKHIRIE